MDTVAPVTCTNATQAQIPHHGHRPLWATTVNRAAGMEVVVSVVVVRQTAPTAILTNPRIPQHPVDLRNMYLAPRRPETHPSLTFYHRHGVGTRVTTDGGWRARRTVLLYQVYHLLFMHVDKNPSPSPSQQIRNSSGTVVVFYLWFFNFLSSPFYISIIPHSVLQFLWMFF